MFKMLRIGCIGVGFVVQPQQIEVMEFGLKNTATKFASIWSKLGKSTVVAFSPCVFSGCAILGDRL